MGYKIIKGWPDESALDYPMELEDNKTVPPGYVFWLNNSGKVELADYASDGSDAYKQFFFCIDTDSVTNGVIGLTGNFMVEVDSDLYEPGNYYSNVTLTAKNGKFAIPEASECVIGRVIKYTSSTGKLIVTWNN